MGSPKSPPDVLEALKKAIETKGETQEEAEIALAVGKGYLSHVFARDYRPGRDISARIADRYGIAVSRWAPPGTGKRKRRRGASEKHQAA